MSSERQTPSPTQSSPIGLLIDAAVEIAVREAIVEMRSANAFPGPQTPPTPVQDEVVPEALPDLQPVLPFQVLAQDVEPPNLQPVLQAQEVPPALLDMPPYRYPEDGVENLIADAAEAAQNAIAVSGNGLDDATQRYRRVDTTVRGYPYRINCFLTRPDSNGHRRFQENIQIGPNSTFFRESTLTYPCQDDEYLQFDPTSIPLFPV